MKRIIKFKDKIIIFKLCKKLDCKWNLFRKLAEKKCCNFEVQINIHTEDNTQ